MNEAAVSTPAAHDDGPVVFTICSRNFLAQASVLYGGLQRHYPNLAFHVILCDAYEGVDFDALPFEIIQFQSLGLPQLDEMARCYNITELNTAIKPFAFLELFERFPGAPVLYFDPDIMVVDRLEELEAAIAAGADCVLTPHLSAPAEFAELDDGKMLIYGIYNLGFCMLRDTPQVRDVVRWWARRLETQCVIDLAAGLFVDQKWADLLPAFIGNTTILRHPGYNVAYWNLSQRTVVARTDHGARSWWVNGQPLRFFHFSGSVVDHPASFSRHSFQFRNATLRDVAELFEEYCRDIERQGRQDYRHIPYAFSWGGTSGHNAHTPATHAPGTHTVLNAAPLGLGAIPPALPLWRAASDTALAGASRTIDARRKRWAIREAALARDGSAAGFCVVCGTKQDFQIAGAAHQAWLCPGCGLDGRARSALHVLFQETTPQQSWQAGTWPAGGELRDRLAMFFTVTDADTATSPDFDLLLDMREGSCQERAGLALQYRDRLRPGGTLLLAVDASDTRGLARMQPLAMLGDAGYSDVRCLMFWSERFGYLTGPMAFFVATKQGIVPRG